MDMRAADADRNRAVEVLQRATGQGYLTLEEFEAALDRVFASRTYRELDAVLAGVPGAPKPSIEWAPQPVPIPQPIAAPPARRRSLPELFGRSPLRAVLTVLFALFLINVLVHAWPIPLIVCGFIWWKRAHHGHGWSDWRRRPAEFV